MLKVSVICDRCKKEISPNAPMVFMGKVLQLKTSMPSKELLTPLKIEQRGPVFLQEILEHKIHLCPSYYAEFEENFLKKKE